MNTLWILLISLFSSSLIAQSFEFEVKGSYMLQSSRNKPIEFSLRWSELNGIIDGKYSDNYFAKNAPVTGEETSVGRTFIVKFPEASQGVKSITILGPLSRPSKTAAALPLSVVTRDVIGNPLTTVKADSQFLSIGNRRIAQLQEDSECVDGFGVLAGYCGMYAGMIGETQDRRNRCNLLFAEAVRMEVGQDSMVTIHLGDGNEFIQTPSHTVGRLPVDPQKNRIDLLSRNCGPLSGVNSSSGSCKILYLTGTFTTVRENRHFEGEYKIVEEETNNVCKYSLSLDRRE